MFKNQVFPAWGHPDSGFMVKNSVAAAALVQAGPGITCAGSRPWHPRGVDSAVWQNSRVRSHGGIHKAFKGKPGKSVGSVLYPAERVWVQPCHQAAEETPERYNDQQHHFFQAPATEQSYGPHGMGLPETLKSHHPPQCTRKTRLGALRFSICPAELRPHFRVIIPTSLSLSFAIGMFFLVCIPPLSLSST